MASLGPWLPGTPAFGHDLCSGRADVEETSALAHAHIDWHETPTAHIFQADLPGVKVHVEEGNVLQISAERTPQVEEEKGHTWHRIERRRGSFVRRFRLPENTVTEEIKCRLEIGVLTVMLPKMEEEQRQRDIRYIDIA